MTSSWDGRLDSKYTMTNSLDNLISGNTVLSGGAGKSGGGKIKGKKGGGRRRRG